MPSSHSSPPAASSGIQTTQDGERHIPQSVRADGSVRREIKIRPGYRPPEDVEVYKNRTADSWKSLVSTGIPGAEGLRAGETIESTGKGKNAKRREARRKVKLACDHNSTNDNGGNAQTSDATNDAVTQKQVPANGPPVENIDPEAEREKQGRNLKKKLRQARELQSKKESGEVLLPERRLMLV